MKFLAIETSSRRGSVALFSDRTLVREDVFEDGLSYGRDLPRQVEGMLAAAGLALADLDAIAVSAGPGSYTGTRVGVTTAKTLGFALERPVVAVDSLRVLAAAFADPSPTAPLLVATVLDGRQTFLYGALHAVEPGGATQDEPRITERLATRVGDAAEVSARIVASAGTDARARLVVGDGTKKFFAAAEDVAGFTPGPPEGDVPSARHLGRLAFDEIEAARWDPERVHALEPRYLRPTEAERKLSLRESSGSAAEE